MRNQVFSEGFEFIDVVGPGERARAQGVGIGDGDFVRERFSVRECNGDTPAEGLLAGVAAMVAACPFRVLFGANAVPESHELGVMHEVRRITPEVMPEAGEQRSGKDVHDAVVKSFTAGGWIHLLRVARADADNGVRVMAGPNDNFPNGVEVGDLAAKTERQVNPGLGLVFGRVLFGKGLENRAAGLAGRRQRHVISGTRAAKHPCDDAILPFVDWGWAFFAAHGPVHGFDGKLAIEAVDRAMRGEKSPSPIYEGEDSVIAWMLGGPGATYDVPLPAPGEPCRSILESFTKEHSAEYQAQAWIDLAFRLRGKIPNLNAIREIVIRTSHHTHSVIGIGSGDPQKMDPSASRETLDHSVMYIFAAALFTGFWHHLRSYAPDLVHDPELVALWHCIRTEEDPEWTRRYHSRNPREKAFGGRVTVTFTDGKTLTDEIAVADAHPLGARPFARPDYINKFKTLTEDLVSQSESERFLETAQQLAKLAPGELATLNVALPPEKLACGTRDKRGIF